MKKFKKGFTITELVIVIAVIAVLAAVLIPTFVTVFDKAKGSVALQETDAVMKDYLAYCNGEIEEGTIFVHTNGDDAYAFIYENGVLDEIDADLTISNNGFTYDEIAYTSSDYEASNAKVVVYEISG